MAGSPYLSCTGSGRPSDPRQHVGHLALVAREGLAVLAQVATLLEQRADDAIRAPERGEQHAVGGNKRAASAELGVSPKTLYSKLAKYAGG